MRSRNSDITLLLSIGILVVAGIACSSASNTATVTNTNTAPSNSTNTAPANIASAPSTSKNIAGNYDAEGTNPDGGGKYKASLVITARDDVYQFSWKSGTNDYDGVGVTSDTAAAVAFTDGKDGQGCGVVLYKINADGSMDGKVGYWGENKMETERAIRKSGSDLEGEYDISGKNPEGQEYKGSLKGLGYLFNWTAPDSLEGFGIRAGNLIAVGFGGKQCSFVGYDIKPDGTLDGRWGFKTSKALGTEVAKKK